MSDLISRQQAIDALCKSECGCTNAECRHRDNTDFCVTCDNVKIIKSLPSAQPKRKKGEWIRNDNGTYSCSACQSWIPEEQHYYARYCLYCGAKMKAGE